MVDLQDNSSLKNLWVDGQRNRFGFLGGSRINIYTGSLVTAYGSTHIEGGWSDGFNIACKSVIVDGNSVVDATDVEITLFHACPNAQTLQVRNNTILNARNSSYAG